MINPIQCSPRKIRKITSAESPTQEEDKITQIYEFYRLLIYPSIIRLKNETGT